MLKNLYRKNGSTVFHLRGGIECGLHSNWSTNFAGAHANHAQENILHYKYMAHIDLTKQKPKPRYKFMWASKLGQSSAHPKFQGWVTQVEVLPDRCSSCRSVCVRERDLSMFRKNISKVDRPSFPIFYSEDNTTLSTPKNLALP